MRSLQGPRDLPWARGRLLRWAEISQGPASLAEREAFLRGVRLGDLFWVTPPMTDLALDAALDIPDWTMATARPSPSGLILWAGALPEVRGRIATGGRVQRGRPVRPSALIWWTQPDGSVGVFLMATVEAAAAALGTALVAAEAPLGPIWTAAFPMHSTPEPIAEAPPEWRGVLALLGATWHLMMEPKLAERAALPQPRKDRDTAARDGGSVSDITVVDLRTLRHVETEREPGGERRHLTHRHYVRGHWRQQWMPSTSTREPRFIAPYIKGPAGAPLLTRERVQV